MSGKHAPWIALAAVGALAAAAPDTAAADSVANGATFEAKPQRDWRIPHISEVYSREQIAGFLAHTWSENAETIEVEGIRERLPPNTPEVWPGILAPVWAVLNPAQAWRIFLPIPPDQAPVEVAPAALASTHREPVATSPIISPDIFYP